MSRIQASIAVTRTDRPASYPWAWSAKLAYDDGPMASSWPAQSGYGATQDVAFTLAREALGDMFKTFLEKRLAR